MSKVDVLAWLDAKVEREWEIERATGLPNGAREPAMAVRAAVAELIEAAKEMRSNFRCVLNVNCKCDENFVGQQTARIDAALANIGSTK